MKAIHVVQRDATETGGALRVAYELVRRLPANGVDARLLFLYGEKGRRAAELPERCDYLRIKTPRHIGRLGLLRQYLRYGEPSIVHFHDDLLWPQLLHIRKRNWASVIHAHGSGVPAPLPSKTRALYALQRRHAAAVVCITEEARASQIRNIGFSPEILRVIYNGVDRSVFSPPEHDARANARKRFGLTDNAIVVGYVGRLHDEMKGCMDFVDLIQRLPDRFVGLMVGLGPDEEVIRKRSRLVGAENRIILAGLVEDVEAAYHAMDVFCFLSHFEGFGLTIAEAMACGLPVVGFSCPGGSGELLTPETGCVIPVRDLDAMAAEVKGAAEGRPPWPRRRLAALRALAERHDWDDAAARLAALYFEICPRRESKGKAALDG